MSEVIKAAQAVIIALGTAGITAYTTISIKNTEIEAVKASRAAQSETGPPAKTALPPPPEDRLGGPSVRTSVPEVPFTAPNLAFAVLGLKPGGLSNIGCQQRINAALIGAGATITATTEGSNFFQMGEARGFVWCAIGVTGISPEIFYGTYGPDGFDTFASRDRLEAAIKPALTDYLAE